MSDENGGHSLNGLWPLATIDFEASALDPASYPIEVGICLWESPDTPLKTWSSLIRPIEHWVERGVWSIASASIHGINQSELQNGLSPATILRRLNRLVGARVCYCDGGSYDVDWNFKLKAAAQVEPLYQLGDWDLLTGRLKLDAYRRMTKWIDRQPIAHRAAADAERLMCAFAVGLGIDCAESIQMDLLSDCSSYDEG